MTKWKCESNACKFAPCAMEMNNDIRPTCCVAMTGIFTKWQEVKEEEEPVTTCNQLPKLTAEVFDRPDCPDWAKYAAVDVQGLAYWYQYLPLADERIGIWSHLKNKRQLIDQLFDSSDWQNSLIERPSRLPDWCKVGEWVWLDPKKICGPAGYKKVKGITGFELTFSDGCCIYFSQKIQQVRPRPYNADEMKALVGKVVELKEYAFVINSYSPVSETVRFNGYNYTAADLLNNNITINGKPCVVLEHFENGEWIE